ncbi:hypothetical protein [Halalkalibacillus halophilus]|uniref:hypothetical protein n=1 Tax=Halalkalibacillus halophilus TaxID=392827 RepID=UPI0004125EB7|nr:hypothetical protein [Halalkalibacillus halophilus]
MMKWIGVILATFFILAGCQSDESQEPMSEADVAEGLEISEDSIMHTEEKDQFTVAFYEEEETFRVGHFAYEDSEWNAKGSSGFDYNKKRPLTSGITGWPTEEDSDEMQYVLLGEMNDETIDHIEVRTPDENFDAEMIGQESDDYWFVFLDGMTQEELIASVTAFDEEGAAIHSDIFQPNPDEEL